MILIMPIGTMMATTANWCITIFKRTTIQVKMTILMPLFDDILISSYPRNGDPGHMILDKQTGILYIADTGANRVLWVNTDDTTYNTENILDPLWYQNPSSTQKEDLAEYSVITGVEWGVLDTGLSRPSGIALEAGRLFVSENGNGDIVAYELSTNGKSATEIDSIQTSASSIMGLEIGPNGHLYYVDNGRDQVIRVDPYTDHDNDGVVDEFDNCPLIFNPSQSNHDFDLLGDACDSDDDGDGLEDEYDDCSLGQINWTSSLLTDYDSDGCADANEDSDDDNDGIWDYADNCQIGELGWISTSVLDYDSDGCKDTVRIWMTMGTIFVILMIQTWIAESLQQVKIYAHLAQAHLILKVGMILIMMAAKTSLKMMMTIMMVSWMNLIIAL